MAGHKTSHTQIQRYQIIDKVLSSDIRPSFEYLLKILRLELKDDLLSESSVHRDLKFMQESLEAPIVYDRKTNGYYYKTPYCFPLKNLTSQEMDVLSIVQTTLKSEVDTNPFFKDGFELLERILPLKKNSLVNDRVYISKNPSPVFKKDVLNKVMYAIRKNCCLDFVYKSKWEPGKNHRIVKPCQLIIDKGMLFLYAADKKNDSKIRLYSFSRMHEVNILWDQHFTLPENYKFAEAFEKGRFGAFQYDEEYDFKIEVYGDERNYLHEYIWADNQKLEDVPEQEKTIITFSSSQWIPIERWLISFGSHAKPLEPDWLVEWWEKEITEMVKKISNSH